MITSIIIPVHNEEKNIIPLTRKISQIVSENKINYEIIFVDDGSVDSTYKVLESLYNSKKYNIKLIKLAKNFGKSAALSAGFKNAKGDIIITMDGDLQDDPAEIPRFISEIKNGFDIVTGWKFERKDPITKIIPSKIFNWLTSKISGLKIHDFNCGYKAYRAEVLRNIKINNDLHRYVLVLAFWKGYSIKEIKVRHHARLAGKSKYGAGRILVGFLDLIKISFIHYFKQKPLYLFGSVGIFMFLIGFIFSIYLLMQYFTTFIVPTRPLMIVIAILFLLGFQAIALGLIGELVTENTKIDEDPFIIKEKKE